MTHIPESDHNLDLVNPKPGDDEIRANAGKACAQCRGFCCLAFTLAFPKSRIPSMLAKARKEARELIRREENHISVMWFYHGKRVEWSIQGSVRAMRLLEDIENLEWFQHRLIPMRWKDKRMNNRRHNKARWQPHYLYTCSAFNVAKRQCMEYEGRPGICRKFICGPATVGEIPVAEHMTAHPNKVEGMDAKYRLQDRANARRKQPVRLSRPAPEPRAAAGGDDVALCGGPGAAQPVDNCEKSDAAVPASAGK